MQASDCEPRFTPRSEYPPAKPEISGVAADARRPRPQCWRLIFGKSVKATTPVSKSPKAMPVPIRSTICCCRDRPAWCYSYASLTPSLNDDPNADGPYWPKSSKTGSNLQQFSMVSHAAYSRCVDKCIHLLPSPSGYLQSSEFRLCVAQCMGRL